MKKMKMFSLGKKSVLMSSIALALTANAQAQEIDQTDNDVEVIQIKGMLSSIQKSTALKRQSSGVVDAISSEDIGKFPDTNLAESLQRITGVSINRSSGEGRQVTVRGLGPQFNTVLFNGRQMPNATSGRGFNFDTVAAEMVSGVEVYKSSSAAIQSGGIGATINVTTTKPLDVGERILVSAKGIYDENASSTTPQISALYSTNPTENFGVLAAVSYQERDTQTDSVEVRRWRSYLSGSGDYMQLSGGYPSNSAGGEALVDYMPTQTAVTRSESNRKRLNANLVLQYALNEDLTATFDANYSDLKVKGRDLESASWRTYGTNEGEVWDVDENNTAIFHQFKDRGMDFFLGAPESREVGLQTGLNLEWFVTDNSILKFDASHATSESNPDQETNVNRSDIQIATMDYQFIVDGDIATHFYDNDDIGYQNAKLHQQDVFSNHYKDEISQLSLDYTYEGDSFTMKSGLMYTDQTKVVESFNNNVGEGADAYAFRGLVDVIGENGLFSSLEEAQAAGYGVTTIDHALIGETAFLSFDPEAAYSWIDTIREVAGDDSLSLDLVRQTDWYEVQEKTLSAYLEFTAELEIEGRPLTVVAGSRIENTSIDSTSLEKTLDSLTFVEAGEDMTLNYSDSVPYTDGDSYDLFLPNMSVKLEATDDLVLRFAASRTITRPELGNMRSARSFSSIRAGDVGQAVSGNPDLKPYMSDNLDFSAEWYIDQYSYVSAGYFRKIVDNFIVTDASTEAIEGVIDPTTGENVLFDIARPRNLQTKQISGWELAGQHAFGDSGFGVIANATFVSTDSEFTIDQTDASAIVGLSDSANLVGFYEKNGIQFRVAYNWRDSFIEQFGHFYETTTGEPTTVDEYSQIDLSASYDINDEVSVFFEGINVTGEDIRKYNRYENQMVFAADGSARFAVGVRGSF
ncbi:TonB-dependent receptor [Catenovulum sp. 2E275]|uniref:TonB-dependent receptor n=1 Tax=Catenovulum sp. 2E275 TaxID=2980497 RepID=UPI0021D12852|nr:TonB-dependent receptor [Catenovulum sp. 2E275]MCU4674058.1 TonB-dependent receptor [Catenovulum sp. 2E275]